jgi:hypothetical protein
VWCRRENQQPTDARVRRIVKSGTGFTHPAARFEASERAPVPNARGVQIHDVHACRLVALGAGAKDATITVVTSPYRGEASV